MRQFLATLILLTLAVPALAVDPPYAGNQTNMTTVYNEGGAIMHRYDKEFLVEKDGDNYIGKVTAAGGNVITYRLLVASGPHLPDTIESLADGEGAIVTLKCIAVYGAKDLPWNPVDYFQVVVGVVE